MHLSNLIESWATVLVFFAKRLAALWVATNSSEWRNLAFQRGVYNFIRVKVWVSNVLEGEWCLLFAGSGARYDYPGWSVSNTQRKLYSNLTFWNQAIANLAILNVSLKKKRKYDDQKLVLLNLIESFVSEWDQ